MSTLRVAIGQAYHLKLDPKLWQAMQPYPPLGALYAARVAGDAGCDVSFHDSMMTENVADWGKFLDDARPDLIVLQEDNFNYLSKMCLSRMRVAAVEMIAQAKPHGVPIVVGGSDVTDNPDFYLENGADVAMLGESERTLADIIGCVAAGTTRDIADLSGVATLAANRVIARERRPAVRRIDELGLPAWELVDLDRYKDLWLRRHGFYSINMVTTRGCPYSCNWCAKPIWGQGYQSRTPEHVADEMVYLRERVNPDHIWFMDDIFGLKPGWAGRFRDALDARELRIPFKCLSRADLLLRPGEVKNLAASGCATVWMGAESGSQKILDAMDKGTLVEQIVDARDALGREGIETGFFIQFGYPGEGMPEIRDTVRMIRRTLPDDLGVSVSYPLPGTLFYENVKDQLREQTHWEDSDDLAMLFEGPFPTRFYRCLHKLVHADLAVHRAWSKIRRGGAPRADGSRRLREWPRLVFQGLRWAGLRLRLAALAAVARATPTPDAASAAD